MTGFGFGSAIGVGIIVGAGGSAGGGGGGCCCCTGARCDAFLDASIASDSSALGILTKPYVESPFEPGLMLALMFFFSVRTGGMLTETTWKN